MRYKKTLIISLLLISIYYQLNSIYTKLDCKSHALTKNSLFVIFEDKYVNFKF